MGIIGMMWMNCIKMSFGWNLKVLIFRKVFTSRGNLFQVVRAGDLLPVSDDESICNVHRVSKQA